MITVTVADECPTCVNANSIDLSQAAFQALDDLSVGTFPSKPYIFTQYRLNHSWLFQSPGPSFKLPASCVYLAGPDPVGVWYHLDDGGAPRRHSRPRRSHTLHWQIPLFFFLSFSSMLFTSAKYLMDPFVMLYLLHGFARWCSSIPVDS